MPQRMQRDCVGRIFRNLIQAKNPKISQGCFFKVCVFLGVLRSPNLPIILSSTFFYLSLTTTFTGSNIHAEGIPEPSLVMYGVVEGVQGADKVRQTSGTLVWIFSSTLEGRNITYMTELSDINGQFSYLIRIPCETQVTGESISANALRISPLFNFYNRGTVTLDGMPLEFKKAVQSSIILTGSDRGKIERVDLRFSLGELADSDGNGLPDDWEITHFNFTGVDPNADPDGDGMTTGDEYKAGTDPKDPASFLVIVGVEDDSESGEFCIEWASALYRSYAVQRSSELMDGYENYAAGIAGNPPMNRFCDPAVGDATKFFYRVVLEE